MVLCLKVCWDGDGMGYTIGYDVAADLKIVQWPTTFLTQPEGLAVGMVIPKKYPPVQL